MCKTSWTTLVCADLTDSLLNREQKFLMVPLNLVILYIYNSIENIRLLHGKTEDYRSIYVALKNGATK